MTSAAALPSAPMKTTAVEYLEKRIAPANIFVTNLNDDLNAGSLRKAIADVAPEHASLHELGDGAVQPAVEGAIVLATEKPDGIAGTNRGWLR